MLNFHYTTNSNFMLWLVLRWVLENEKLLICIIDTDMSYVFLLLVAHRLCSE